MFANPIKKEILHIREYLCRTYPSDMSYRCQLLYPLETMLAGRIVYLVAEGDYLYVVSDEDMKAKFQIPISNINDTRMYSDIISTSAPLTEQQVYNQGLPSARQIVYVTIEYVDQAGENALLRLAFAEGQLSDKYNIMSMNTPKDPELYIKRYIKQRSQ